MVRVRVTAKDVREPCTLPYRFVFLACPRGNVSELRTCPGLYAFLAYLRSEVAAIRFLEETSRFIR